MADAAGAEGDAAEGFEGGFEQGVGAFGGCPVGVDQLVAGAVVDGEVVALEWDVDTDPGAGVALVGQGR